MVGMILMPCFSVIIPLYNKGPHIERTINSVLNQTIQDFEIIVIDGGSIDNGPALVKSYTDNRITLMVQKGRGVSAARNQAVEHSRSDLIAFLDADDEWMPGHLETIMRLRLDYPAAGAYTTAYQIIEENGLQRWANYKELPSAPWRGEIPNYFKSGALGDYPVWTSVVCIPKKIYDEMGGFPEAAWFGEDADLFGKIALKYPIAFDWYLGGLYHWGAVNRACKKQIPLEEEPFVKTAKNAVQNNLVSPEILNDVNEYVVSKEFDRAVRHLDAGKTWCAVKILLSLRTKYKRRAQLILILMAISHLYHLNQYLRMKKLKRTGFKTPVPQKPSFE
jgi:glycosyltransferase involved in cell wall biosynthesis